MSDIISQGTILIRGDALLPRSMKLESQAFLAGWRRISAEYRGELDRQIREAGWTFFYLAGEIRANAFGQGEPAARRALERILAGPELERFNCLEITASKPVRFLGLPLTTVTAHARQIQDGATLLQPRWTGNRAQQDSTNELRNEDLAEVSQA
jgi:hypothetical protein